MSEEPLHAQIRQSIQSNITDGSWPPQFKIPTEQSIASQYNVSRMTVRQAIQKLVERGFLYRKRGMGTFVSPVRMTRDLGTLTSFSEDAHARGLSLSTQVEKIEIMSAVGEAADTLELSDSENIICVERVRHYDESPVALQTLYVHESLCPELSDPSVAVRSVYEYYEKDKYIRIGWGIQNIEARMPTKAEQRKLECSETCALLIVKRTTFMDNGTPLELSETKYRGDQQSYTITLQR